MRNHSAAGSRTHSRQGSQSRSAATSSSTTQVPTGAHQPPTANRPSGPSASDTTSASSPPSCNSNDSLPPQLSKWIASLQTAFAADLLQLQHDLEATKRTALAACATAHAAQVADLESQLAELQTALARAQPAIKYRPQAHQLLANTFRARQDTRTCSALFRLWTKRAQLMVEERRKMVAAQKLAQGVVVRKAFNGWFRAVREAWRQEREKRLDEKTKVAVSQTTHDLESRLRDLERELQDEKRRRHALVREQKVHEAEMRAAFVRGLSALNMETMAVLQPMMLQAEHDCQDGDSDNESIIVVQSADEAQSVVMDAHQWHQDHTATPVAAAPAGGNLHIADNPADPLRLSVLSSSYSSIHRSTSPIPSGVARTTVSSQSPHHRPPTNAVASRPSSVASNHHKSAPSKQARKKSEGGSTSASRRSSFSFRAPDESNGNVRSHAPDPVRLMQGKKHHSSTASVKSLREPVYVERHPRPPQVQGNGGQGTGLARGQTGRVGPGMATGFFSPS